MIQWFPIVIFISVPLQFNDLTTLFRSGLIPIFASIILVLRPVNFKNYKNVSLVFTLLVGVYLVSWQMNEQSYADFLFGSYGRNLGILCLIGIYLLTIQSAKEFSISSHQLVNSFYVVLILAIVYGLLQEFGTDIINWEKGAGPGSTLGNPNFSSSLFGMLSGIPLYYAIKSKKLYRNFHITIYITTLSLILLSGSVQGLVLYGVNFIFIFLKNKLGAKFIILTVISTSLVLILVLSNKLKLFQNLQTRVNSQIQFDERIEHWKYGLRVFRESPIIGVGLDNLQKFGGEFRTIDMFEWGKYTIPDRAHNVFIDYLAFGGIFAGLLWLTFVLMIFHHFYILKAGAKNSSTQTEYDVIFLIFLSYLIQASISPDHLVLNVYGMMSAGAVLGRYINHINGNVRTINANKIN